MRIIYCLSRVCWSYSDICVRLLWNKRILRRWRWVTREIGSASWHMPPLPRVTPPSLLWISMHNTHGWKSYQVYFHLQKTSCHLDFRGGSNDHLTEDCTGAKQMRENSRRHIEWPTICSFSPPKRDDLCSYLAGRVFPSINTSYVLAKKGDDWINRYMVLQLSC